MNNEGCFKECTNCSKVPNCCANFNLIDAPTLNKEEVKKISCFVKNNDFFNIKENNIYTLKTVGNKCIFFVNNQCLIYKNRPLDCKLFPFDLIKKDNKYYLIIYNLSCIDINNFIENIKYIEKIITDIKPWIKDFTSESNFLKLKTIKYKIIKEIIV